jgi:hypothetical protein
MDTLDHLMARENIMPRLNQRILSSADNQVTHRTVPVPVISIKCNFLELPIFSRKSQ